MTAYDVRARATAARLLGGKGQAVTLKRAGPDGSTYDTSASAYTGGTPPAPESCFGAVFEYSTFIRSGLRLEKGDPILAGDKQLLLAALNAAGVAIARPKPGDIVTVSGVDFTITSVAPLSPAGTDIYHECNIRGAV